jgi:hypothetical protein
MSELSCGLSLIFSMRPFGVPYLLYSFAWLIAQPVYLLTLLSVFFTFIIFDVCNLVGLNDDQMHSSNDYICSDYDYTECLPLLTDNPIPNFIFLSGF